MNDALPLSQMYNLGRLAGAGDEVAFEADDAARAAIAQWSDVVEVRRFTVTAKLKKLSSTRFVIDETLDIDAVQACVVTLGPVEARINRQFVRELHFTGPARHRPNATEPLPAESIVVGDLGEGEPPEEITSLHYDLAAPALEEYFLTLEPYPRAPGAEFAAPVTPADPEDHPFAVLKRLKSEG